MKNPPIRANVAKMESIPVVGVEIRKESTDPVLAPSFFKDKAAGRTPQEHNGSGIPKSEALTTDKKLLPPRCFATVPESTTT